MLMLIIKLYCSLSVKSYKMKRHYHRKTRHKYWWRIWFLTHV